MKYNYTKATKEHIKQMAVRKKYLELFNAKLAKLYTDFTDLAKELGDHEELSKLPSRLHSNFHSNNELSRWSNVLFTVNQHVALQSNYKYRRIALDCKVFVSMNKLIKLLDKRPLLEFKKFLDEVDQFACDVGVAVGSYTTYKKAAENMPWIEEFHPDYDKAPVCKIVPIETIQKINGLMGV